LRPPARLTVEQCCALNVTKLTRDGVFRAAPGTRWFSNWTDGSGQEIRKIVFRCETWQGLSICFNYRVEDGRPGPLRIQTEVIPVTSTPCHLGGSRRWFQCPLCGGRVGVLYARPNESRFACRKCQDLTYYSAQTHNSRIDRLLRGSLLELSNVVAADAIKFGTLFLRVGRILCRRLERRAASYRSRRRKICSL